MILPTAPSAYDRTDQDRLRNALMMDVTRLEQALAVANLGCHVYASAAQSIPFNTETVLTFDTEVFDVGALHSTVTNTGRITIPNGGGRNRLWHIGAQVAFVDAGEVLHARGLKIRKNGATFLTVVQITPMAGDQTCLYTACLDQPADGDYYEAVTFQDRGAGTALNTVGGQAFTWFEAAATW